MTISVPCLLNWSQRSLPSSSVFDSSHPLDGDDDDDDEVRCGSVIGADLPAEVDVMDEEEEENDEDDVDEELDSLPFGGVNVKLLGDNDLFSVF